jgi:hypothetical protein
VSARNRDLWREVRAEIGTMVRAHTSRSAAERAAARERWAALKQRSEEASPSADFRAELNVILGDAVARLQALQDEIERR